MTFQYLEWKFPEKRGYILLGFLIPTSKSNIWIKKTNTFIIVAFSTAFDCVEKFSFQIFTIFVSLSTATALVRLSSSLTCVPPAVSLLNPPNFNFHIANKVGFD